MRPPVLPPLFRALHQVPEQERLHPDRHHWEQLLRCGEGRLLHHPQECVPLCNCCWTRRGLHVHREDIYLRVLNLRMLHYSYDIRGL